MGTLNETEQPKIAEYTAKTLEDALNQAARDFRVSIQAIRYETIRDTTRTILGLVHTGDVTIRAWVVPPPRKAVEPQAPPKVDKARQETPSAAVQTKQKTPSTAALDRNPPELADVAQEVLASLLDKMGILGAVEIADPGGELDPEREEVSPLILNIVGDDLGCLIGRRGETLRDLQFMVRLIVSRKLGVWPNVVVDVENYKARRANSLQSLAQRMADRVRETGQPIALEPMPAHERRIVHLALRDDPDVYTESTGEGDRRRVQILPKS